MGEENSGDTVTRPIDPKHVEEARELRKFLVSRKHVWTCVCQECEDALAAFLAQRESSDTQTISAIADVLEKYGRAFTNPVYEVEQLCKSAQLPAPPAAEGKESK